MKLFVIGNGFDLDHGLNTQYKDFKEYLISNYDVKGFIQPPTYHDESLSIEEAANFIYSVIDSAACDENWSDLEESLGRLDYSEWINHIDFELSSKSIFEIIRNNQENVYYYSSLIDRLQELISEWLEYTCDNSITLKFKYKKVFSNESFFLTFNYTDTLEKLYHVPKQNICHIHGMIYQDLIIGHGDKNSKLSNESTIGVDEEINSVHQFLYKNTNKIIKNNKTFFDKLSNIDEIYFIGWSFSDIDIEYLNHIINIVGNKKVIVHFTVFDSKDSNKISKMESKLSSLNYVVGKPI